MPAQTNLTLWNALRKSNASFASHTSEGTAALFTERGFQQLSQTDPQAISDFFGLSVRAALQIVNISHAVDTLSGAGVGQTFDNPFGGFIQRIATQTVKPTSPRYKNLQNGQSVDRWTIRKPETFERFWKQNFDYQSWITLDEIDMKQIFISEYGMSEYLAGIMAGLENGYVIQRFLNKLECIHQGLIDTNLKDSQIVFVPSTDLTVTDNALQFIYTILNIIGSMKASPQTSAYNAMGFSDKQDISRLRLLVRAGYAAALKVYTLAGTFNPQDLDLGIDVVEVENFGGVYYQTTAGVRLYPAYDAKTGEEIGLAETENANTATHKASDSDVEAVDPHSDVVAVLMDMGWMFETIQNGYRVIPTQLNEAGLYVNFWASAPNNSINYDRLYNFVVFKAEPEEPETPEPQSVDAPQAKTANTTK